MACSATAYAQSSKLESYKFELQERIEQAVSRIVNSHLTDREYIAYVKVSLQENHDSNASGNEENLPFSEFKMVEKINPSHSEMPFHVSGLQINLVVDESVAEDKLNLLKSIITDRFSDYQNFSIVDSRANFTAPVNDTVKSDLEKTMLEREKAMLEVERLRLEMTKNQLEKVKDDQAVVERQKKEEGEASQVSSGEEEIEVGVFEKYQLIIMSLLLGVAGILAFLLGSSALRKGLIPVSEAIGNIGSSLESASSTMSSSGSSQSSGGSSVVSAVNSSSSSGNVVGGMDGGNRQSAIGKGDAASNEVQAFDEANSEEYNAFVLEVQDKVQVLAAEGSFRFYREFTDMIDRESEIIHAASIIVAVNRETAELLLSNISSQQLARLRSFMGSKGMMAEARKFRKKSLEEFYGRIALDEYLASPLLEVKQAEWLIRKSNEDLAKLFKTIDEKRASQLVACFSPTRVNKILEATDDDNIRAKIMSSVTQVSQLKSSDIGPLFEYLSSEFSSIDQQSPRSYGVVDETSYIVRFMEGLGVEEKENFIRKIDPNSSLAMRMRKVYLPFNTILELPKTLLLEIFLDRPNDQIGKILFAANDDVRKHVLDLLPDIKKATVLDKLNILDADITFLEKNKKESWQAQSAINEYMRQMYIDGLFQLDNKNDENISNNAA